MQYLELRKKVMERRGIDEDRLNLLIKNAQLWHNPLNFDKGQKLKAKLGVEYMFDEALKRERMGNRRYFPFHDHDMTDPDNVMFLFRSCPNWKRYNQVWAKYAPRGLRSEVIYLLAVTEMSVRGFKHEKAKIAELREAGHDVIESSYQQDLAGIDIFVDGEPMQIKSPATAKAMRGVIG